MTTTAPTPPGPPPHHERRSNATADALPASTTPIADADGIAITDAGDHARQDALTLAVADARHVIPRMEVDELRQLTAAIADDAFEQFARMRKAIVASSVTALATSFIQVADAWEAAHVARIALCAADE